MARYPQKIGLWGVRGAEEYCYRLDFAPALLSVRREGAIGWICIMSELYCPGRLYGFLYSSA